MQHFATIFMLNLLTSIDNAIVIGGIAQKSKYLLPLAGCAAFLLTICRTALIVGVISIANAPVWRIGLGTAVFVVSVHMARSPSTERRKEPSFLKLLMVIIITDLALSIDNILSIATVSQNAVVIAIGVFASLLPLLLLIPFIVEVMNRIVWIQILAAGFVAELAVDTIMDDRLIMARIPGGWIEVVIRVADAFRKVECMIRINMLGTCLNACLVNTYSNPIENWRVMTAWQR